MDKAKLLAGRSYGLTPHEIPGVGTVVVRPLTRAEAFSLRGKGFDEEVLERKVLALGLVDPALTEEEVAEWQKVASSGEVDTLMGVISEISGMTKTAAKEAYKSAGE